MSDTTPADASCLCGDLQSQHRLCEDHDECLGAHCRGNDEPCSEFRSAPHIEGEPPAAVPTARRTPAEIERRAREIVVLASVTRHEVPEKGLVVVVERVLIEAIARLCMECGSMKPDAHELWAMAQLLPNEGIEDGVARIEDILAECGGVVDAQNENSDD